VRYNYYTYNRSYFSSVDSQKKIQEQGHKVKIWPPFVHKL